MKLKTTSAILRQIEALEGIAQAQLDGMFQAHYADGSVRWVDAGDAILLVLHGDPNGDIVAFTDNGNEGNGKLAALLNGLLDV